MAARTYDVLCLSHLRWGFVWQRPQHLLSRCAQDGRVFFFEEPVDCEDVRLVVHEAEPGIVVAQPHCPPGGSLEERDAIQRALLDELVGRFAVTASATSSSGSPRRWRRGSRRI
jgi:UDP-galactopyranose mutase